MGMATLQLLLQLLFGTLLIVLQVSRGACDVSFGTADGTEEWGYADVRQGAHLFWWLYYKDVSSPADVPLVLWLQGGPGASGAGFGNFEEVGPLYTNLTERESTWVKLVHLLFVDNPVGTGFSYVDEPSLLTTTNKQVSDDLVAFLKTFFSTHEALKKSPFYIVAESYGGKYASEVGVAIFTTIEEGGLDFNFQGVALGDTWVSPTDFVLAWGPLLQSVSLVDEAGNDYLNSIAELAVEELAKGHGTNSTFIWGDLEEAVLELTDNVDFYNFLRHESESDSSSSAGLKRKLGSRHLKRFEPDPLEVIMNGPIREKLSIIPSFVRWSESSGSVFQALASDFMLDTIDKVDELLSLGVDVTIYSGQLDLICCTTGTEAWVQKLKWSGLASFNVAKRTPLYCGGDSQTQAFVKKYENLAFYWILNAGHMVPTDNPCGALKLLSLITKQGSAVEKSDKWSILSAEGFP
ncbi:unnamed protein product [Calypogeia fissa]